MLHYIYIFGLYFHISIFPYLHIIYYIFYNISYILYLISYILYIIYYLLYMMCYMLYVIYCLSYIIYYLLYIIYYISYFIHYISGWMVQIISQLGTWWSMAISNLNLLLIWLWKSNMCACSPRLPCWQNYSDCWRTVLGPSIAPYIHTYIHT